MHMYEIDDGQSEPGYQHQNPAERCPSCCITSPGHETEHQRERGCRYASARLGSRCRCASARPRTGPRSTRVQPSVEQSVRGVDGIGYVDAAVSSSHAKPEQAD
eukprot:scaffold15050_cov130-Amphora_coffeaeformis.AAC.1